MQTKVAIFPRDRQQRRRKRHDEQQCAEAVLHGLRKWQADYLKDADEHRDANKQNWHADYRKDQASKQQAQSIFGEGPTG